MPQYKLGRRPALIPAGLRDLTFYAAGRLPKAPAKVAVPAVADWGMLGNDIWGDCGVAGLQHGLQADAADVGAAGSFPSEQDCISYYLGYTDGQDSGVVLSQFLAYVREKGYYGHALAAYAPVSVSDVRTLRFAINAYDAAYVGITVTDGMMQAVQGAGPWTWTLEDTQGPEAGGHCIILCGYDSHWLYGITWGSTVRIAWPAWHEMADEAWALLTGELASAGADGHGISLAALQADLSRLAR